MVSVSAHKEQEPVRGKEEGAPGCVLADVVSLVGQKRALEGTGGDDRETQRHRGVAGVGDQPRESARSRAVEHKKAMVSTRPLERQQPGRYAEHRVRKGPHEPEEPQSTTHGIEATRPGPERKERRAPGGTGTRRWHGGDGIQSLGGRPPDTRCVRRRGAAHPSEDLWQRPRYESRRGGVTRRSCPEYRRPGAALEPLGR